LQCFKDTARAQEGEKAAVRVLSGNQLPAANADAVSACPDSGGMIILIHHRVKVKKCTYS